MPTGLTGSRPVFCLYPFNWRKRLDFGTGTFGDMGCHILDPVFGAISVGNPLSIRSELPGPNTYNWSLDVQVKFVFPGTQYTTDSVSLTWYNGRGKVGRWRDCETRVLCVENTLASLSYVGGLRVVFGYFP